jgi:hypothetical protein
MPILKPWGDPPMYPGKRAPIDASEERAAFRRVVLPGFFTMLGIRSLSGRDLSPADRIGTPLVMVVNDVFALEFFPGENPIGQRVVMPGGLNPLEYEVVGIVDSARTELVGDGPYASVYVSANQRPLGNINVLIRSTLPPERLTEAVRKLVAARDPEIPVDPLVRMDDIVAESLTPQRVTTVTYITFSLIALLLASLGLYGVPPADPLTFAVVSVLLLAVAFTASAWPAWRAGHIDPMQALRGK